MIEILLLKNKNVYLPILGLFFGLSLSAQGVKRVVSRQNTAVTSTSMYSSKNVRKAGTSNNNEIVVEAENFDTQTETDLRKWYLVSKYDTPKVRKDYDNPHLLGVSNGRYLELLPETIYTPKGKSSKAEGKNYSNTPGKMAALSYKVDFSSAGRYYVWLRCFATSGNDNSMHVGINDNWPQSGKQLYICSKLQNKWSWTSHQFSGSEECGNRKRIFIDVKKPGMNNVMFSMREDGLEFDKFIVTKNPNFMPQ